MKHFSKRAVRYALWGLGGAALAVLILILGFGGVGGFARAAKFAAAMRVIKSNFVGNYDPDAVTDAALAGAVASLDDNWSYYMDAASYDAYEDYSANRYQGIGVTIRQDEVTGGFLVLAVTKDGPAQKAGIVPGDIIMGVDGTSVAGGTTDELRALIQADFGRDAMVTVQSAEGESREVAVSCEEIYSSPVKYELLDGHVGYVAVTNFRQGAAREGVAAIEELLEQGADSFVFDVRSDPGGQVTELVELLDRILPEGDLFIRADKKGHEEIETSDETCLDLPMAVVVNADSYSAAEFFAAALRDYDWAVVVGQPTTGKARSQVTYTLWDGSAIHLSSYTYLTPSRTDLYEAGGLVPDVTAALTEEELLQYQTGWLEPADDPQIQAAIDALGA